MSEVSPDEILVVDKRKDKSTFASNTKSVQNIIDKLGGVHNIHLARLGSSRKTMFVEGEDIGVLGSMQNALFPSSQEPLSTIPNFSFGGWGNWKAAIWSSDLLRKEMGGEIETYFIMDRDFHTKTEIQAVKRYAKKLGVNLHIWSRKEIENYLLIPSAIERIINRLLAAGEKRVKEIDVENQMFDFADKLKEHVIDKMADAVYFASKDKGKGVSWARNKVKPQVEKNWKDPGKVVEMVPGKKLIRMMSGWSQKKFKVAFGAAGIAREIRSNEIPEEMAEVLSSIEAKRPL